MGRKKRKVEVEVVDLEQEEQNRFQPATQGSCCLCGQAATQVYVAAAASADRQLNVAAAASADRLPPRYAGLNKGLALVLV